MVATHPAPGGRMAKRFIRPKEAVPLGVAVSATENKQLEELAFKLRLSMAAVLRVLTVAALRKPDLKAWESIRDELLKAGQEPDKSEGPPKRKPGRPPKPKA